MYSHPMALHSTETKKRKQVDLSQAVLEFASQATFADCTAHAQALVEEDLSGHGVLDADEHHASSALEDMERKDVLQDVQEEHTVPSDALQAADSLDMEAPTNGDLGLALQEMVSLVSVWSRSCVPVRSNSLPTEDAPHGFKRQPTLRLSGPVVHINSTAAATKIQSSMNGFARSILETQGRRIV